MVVARQLGANDLPEIYSAFKAAAAEIEPLTNQLIMLTQQSVKMCQANINIYM